MVLDSGEKAAKLTQSLLTFSRKQVMNPKPVDLCEIISRFRSILGRIIPEDIDFTTRIYERTLIVMADSGQMEQVLMNLITNAKDAMPHGGNLFIELSPVVVEPGYLKIHGLRTPGHYACLSVSDTGCGMDEDTKLRIFEPFFTTKEVGKGTGLGMSIIYGIIKQHNGYINVYSEPAIGTTFKIYLPLIAGTEHQVRDTEGSRPLRGGSETVLLVEDDPTVRELHKTMLEEGGYTVIEAVDGEDGLKKFHRDDAVIDLIVTDVIMPRMDGSSMEEKIRAVRPDIKVLFMSGYTKDIVFGKGIIEERSNLLVKPVRVDELLDKVRKVLDSV
jgi:CheY-like chemotaxis protein